MDGEEMPPVDQTGEQVEGSHQVSSQVNNGNVTANQSNEIKLEVTKDRANDRLNSDISAVQSKQKISGHNEMGSN